MRLKAGAGKRQIEIPEEYLAVENFGRVQDPLHARAVVLELGVRMVLVSLEVTSVPGEEIGRMREQIAGRLETAPQNVWVCAVHSFSSPHLMPDSVLKTAEKIALKEQYREALCEAALGASVDALEQLQDAVLKVGEADCGIVANRDVELPEGWWVGTGGDGPSDRRVTVLNLESRKGEQIALIAHFAMQSSVMDQAVLADGKKPVTSDVAGNACRIAEEALGGTVLYLIGAAGDQAPVEKAVQETFRGRERIRTDRGEEGFAICRRLAGELADAMLAAGSAAEALEDGERLRLGTEQVTVPAKRMLGDVHTLVPVHSYEYPADGEREMEIDAFCIGDLALLGIKPELNCVTGREITEGSCFGRTLVCTMVNGGAKYMADAASYERCSYEAMNSPWNKGAAELLCAGSIRLLEHLKNQE